MWDLGQRLHVYLFFFHSFTYHVFIGIFAHVFAKEIRKQLYLYVTKIDLLCDHSHNRLHRFMTPPNKLPE